jgi:hypothetical protein
MKKYQTFKVHLFPSSDVRFKYYSCEHGLRVRTKQSVHARQGYLIGWWKVT